jgi:hypothetical protein
MILVAISILIFNIPFGYWRANVKKFSFQWILAIHLPIPFIIIERLAGGIGFAWITYPLMITAFFLGQFLGGKLYLFLKNYKHYPVSSCFIMDCYRNCWS